MLTAFKAIVREAVRRLRTGQAARVTPLRHRAHPITSVRRPMPARLARRPSAPYPTWHGALPAQSPALVQKTIQGFGITKRNGAQHERHPH